MREGTNVLRLKRFEVIEKGRKVTVLETMIREFDTMTADLARQIAAEEERTRIKDTRHVAYSTFATAARARRTNLLASLAVLELKLDAARSEFDDATTVLRGLELIQNHAPPFYVAAQGERAIAGASPISDSSLFTTTVATSSAR